MHPKGQFCPPEGCSDPKPGIWREISVGGCVFGLRESRSAAIQGPPVPSETSVLVDGTLIDLCGATLLWRSAEGKIYFYHYTKQVTDFSKISGLFRKSTDMGKGGLKTRDVINE